MKQSTLCSYLKVQKWGNKILVATTGWDVSAFQGFPAVFKLVLKRETMEQNFFYKKTMLLHSQGLNLCLQIQSPMCWPVRQLVSFTAAQVKVMPGSPVLAGDYRSTCFYMIWELKGFISSQDRVLTPRYSVHSTCLKMKQNSQLSNFPHLQYMHSNSDTLPLKGEHSKLDRISLEIPVCGKKLLAIHTRG